MKVENFVIFSVGTATCYSAENTHAYKSGHVASGHFVFGRDILCEFDYSLLAIGSNYASNKGMPAVSKLLYL